MGIQKVKDHTRGCGKRKPGGVYLVTDPLLMRSCGRLPIPLEACPTCGQGIVWSRQWKWIDGDEIAAEAKLKKCEEPDGCIMCPLADNGPKFGRSGMLWVGEKFYSTRSFCEEAEKIGISRRVKFLPKQFKIGETWVFLAHVQACPPTEEKPKGAPGTFFCFRPQRAEYVVKGDEPPEELERLEKRGLTLVDLEPADDEDGATIGDEEDDPL